MPRFSPASALAALALLCFAAPPARAQPTIFSNFTGSTLFGPAGNGQTEVARPPDTDGSIGAFNTASGASAPGAFQQYAEFINNSFTVFDANTGQQQSRTFDENFWTDAGVDLTGATFLSDPRITYDQPSGRWFASELTVPVDANDNLGPNRYLVAVSRSANLSDGFTGFSLNANNSGDAFFADYDMLGVNGSGVYVGSINFPSNSGGRAAAGMLIIPKADLLAPTPTVANATLFDNRSRNLAGYTPHPAIDLGGAGGPGTNNTAGLEYALSDSNRTNTGLVLSTITVSASPGASTWNTPGDNVAVTPFNNPSAARQPGGPNNIDTIDPRFESNVYLVNGQLWGVRVVNIGGSGTDPNSGFTLGGHDVLQYFRIDPTTNTVLTEGVVGDGDLDHDYYAPAICVNGLGNVVIGYTRSGPNDSDFPSSFASLGQYTDAGVTFGDPFLLKAGAGPYDFPADPANNDPGDNPNRWGDYSVVTLDPLDPTRFWVHQEWASSTPYQNASGNTIRTWSTQITGLQIAAAPEPSPVAVFALGALGLVGLVRLRRRQPAERLS